MQYKKIAFLPYELEAEDVDTTKNSFAEIKTPFMNSSPFEI